jgi:uncharacterized protein
MIPESDLLSLTVSGVAEFSIIGPLPDNLLAASPALARTSLTSSRSGALLKLCVLSEVIEGSRSVSTSPFLFEQTTYQFHLVIDAVSGPPVRMLLRGADLLAGRYRVGKVQEAYAVPVNFQSEVGYTDLELWRGDERLFALRLEVFPTKLDYRTDLLELRADLQMEVRDLVFELYGRTFQLLSRGVRSRPTNIGWLALLREEFQRIVQALETIVRSPLQRVEVTHELGRANRPSRPSATVRQYLRRNASKCAHAASGHFAACGRSWVSPQLPYVRKSLTTDTPENRFVAATISKMRSRLRRLLGQLAGVQKRERFESWTGFLEEADHRLRHFQTRTFLGDLSGQHGHVSPTLALHLTPGYREFFSSSIALDSFLEIGGGPLEMPEKDLATLYELWCFVALAGILRKELNLTVRRPTWLNVTQRRVALELVKGRHSVLSMEKDGTECLRVVYNRQDPTPTGDCKPDNTLEIFKRGQSHPFRYVFDAKYRIQSDPSYIKTYLAPGPPPDAIHRMHAYRDQIVAEQTAGVRSPTPESTVWDLGYRRWVQQTVGAFVLYPYAGADAEQNRFVKAIDSVGVGGLPFLPSRRNEVTRLLRKIIETSSDAIEDTTVELSTVEERQRIEWAHEYGLIAIVRSPEQLNYIRDKGVYHMPYSQHWALRLRADFVLLLLSESSFPGFAGIGFEAAIKSVHFGERHEISPPPPPSRSENREHERYIWFKLGPIIVRTKPLSYSGQPPRFAFTTRLAYREACDLADLLLIREPERRFRRECESEGISVQVYDESVSNAQVFDVGQLRLRFKVNIAGCEPLSVRFDPVAMVFQWPPDGRFTWSDLMYEPKECIAKLRHRRV